MKPLLHSERVVSDRTPIFFADPAGILAFEISRLLSEEFLPVILTQRSFDTSETKRAIIIQYRSRIPKIPDNRFEAICFIQGTEKISSGLFDNLLKDAKKRNIPFLYIASRRNHSSKCIAKASSFEHGRVFLYGDIIDGVFSNPASLMVQHARQKLKIVLRGQGLQKISPVSLQFVTDSIVRYGIIEKTAHPCLVIAPRGEMYELSLARILQQLNPQIAIYFVHGAVRHQQDEGLPEGSLTVSEDDGSLKDKLRRELLVAEAEYKPTIDAHRSHPRFFRYFYMAFFSVFLFIGVVVFLTAGMAFFGERLLYRSVAQMTAMRFSEARQQADFAKSSLVISKSSMQLLMPIAELLGIEQSVARLNKKLDSGEKGAELLSEAADAAEVYHTLFMTTIPVKKSELQRATQQIKNSILAISQLSAEGEFADEYRKRFLQNKKSIDLFLATSDILPSLLGFEKEKKYLILFQNNNELRPGGGFIGSFAVISIKNGKLGEFKVQDVYDADGQLKGHVEPPRALKKYLGASHWYLRDSNFSPDFPESAANAAFFLTLETGQKVDGVIAVDTSVLEEMLKVTGPLRLGGSQKEVTDKNVVELTQSGVEDDFFPGSTQKKDFLNELYATIRTKAFEAKGKSGVGLFGVLSAGISQKHILIAFSDAKLSLPFLLQGVSSTLQSYTAKNNGVTDFFGINEANVGANKVNKYISRSFLYNVAIADSGEVETAIIETIENTSGKGSKYGGDYNVYVRLLLPEGVSPSELLIDGIKQVLLAPLDSDSEQQARGAVAVNTLEVERVDIKGKSTYGFFLVVPTNTKKTIVVKYIQRPKAIGPLGSYSLTLFKQPGTGPDPYAFSVSLPTGMRLLSSSVELDRDGSRYVLLSRLLEDAKIQITYGKK